MTKRALITQAVKTTVTSAAFCPNSSMVANCEAPARTISDIPMAWETDRPASTAAIPAIAPKGMTPAMMGAKSAAPARKAWRGFWGRVTSPQASGRT